MDRQIRRLGIVLLFLFVALFAKLNELHVVRASDLAADPRNTRKVVRDFGRPRGEIVTSDGAVLARSVEADSPFKRLREYPEKDLFAHVTGWFSFTYGSEGAERTFNDDLAGRRAELRLRRPQDLLADRDTTGDVVLTMSKALQQLAATELGDRRGSVVALDPRNGAILAMVSHPRYDPNPLAAHDQKVVQAAYAELQQRDGQPMLPRAYRRSLSPGSTFKIVTAATALEDVPEVSTRRYPTLRELQLPQTNRPLRNFGGSSCGGALPDLMRVSCNTGFAQMGLDVGAEALSKRAGEFGFRDRPPLDLPAVARSFFPEADAFARDKPALAQSAIGQRDVQATPLQMALVAAAVGNGGVAMRPHVLAEVRASDGAVVRTYSPEPWLRTTTPQTAERLRALMVDVVNAGTARRAAVPGVQVAAKTGTAQTGTGTAHAWIVAFAPAEAPRVAVAVVLENQPEVSETTGGRLAAPIASNLIRAALGTPVG